MNLCLQQGIFFDKFKLAVVKLSYKTRNKENVNNLDQY